MSVEEVEDEFDKLTKSQQSEVIGTASLGYIDTDVEYGGYTFGLRTLYIEEDLAAAVAIKPYKDSIREPQAWATAVVAASLTHINGDYDFCPDISHSTLENVKAKFRWITNKRFHFTVIEFLYSHCNRLAQEQAGIIERVENLSPAGQTGSSDLERIFIEQGLFNDDAAPAE